MANQSSNQSLNHVELINRIRSSQEEESKLILELEKLPQDNDSLVQQGKILRTLVENSNDREISFKKLQTIYSLLDESQANSKMQMKDQMNHMSLVEQNIQDSRDQMLKNRNINIGNLRGSQINTYYSDMYRAMAGVVLKVVYLCVPFLILAILKNRGLINANIFSGGIILLIVIGVFTIIPTILDIRARNNMVFSEYDFPANMQDGGGSSEGPKMPSISLPSIVCVGPACCTAGMIYDNEREVCVVKSGTESFISGQSVSHDTELVGAPNV